MFRGDERRGERFPATGAVRCSAKGCAGEAPYTPFLYVAQRGRERVSRIPLPLRLCFEHRRAFERTFLTPGRRAEIESALRSAGHAPPDWSRTTLEFAEGRA